MALTSKSHPLEIAAVRASPTHGRIGITFCPGKHDNAAMTGAWLVILPPILRDVANEIAIEDGVIWVYGVSEDGVQVHRLSI